MHSLLTNFIDKMPEKIKDLRVKTEEITRLDDSYNNQNNVNLSLYGGNSVGGVGVNSSFNNYYSLSSTNHASQYNINNINRFAHSVTINVSHDFDDFLNLVCQNLSFFLFFKSILILI
jgi:hypothetical protein